ncbi:MAG: ERF family protein [Dysgonamonadaceae bacterium]|jgi:hypothetical protein|nr:ERF family protein [Dysgonamonadaceae bacterium]
METKNLFKKINAIRNEMSVISTGNTESTSTTGKQFKGWTYIQLSDFLPALQQKISDQNLFYTFENSEIKILKVTEKKETMGTVADVEKAILYKDIKLTVLDMESEETAEYCEQYFFDINTSSITGTFSNESYARRKMLINFFGIVENDGKEQHEANIQQNSQIPNTERKPVRETVISQNLNKKSTSILEL